MSGSIRHYVTALLTSMMVLAASPGVLQPKAFLNDDVSAAWGREFGTPGVTGTISSLHVLPDGQLMGIGPMSFIMGVDTKGFGVWNGTSWEALAPESNTRVRAVSALSALSDGRLVLSGALEEDGQINSGIFIQDGVEWTPIGFPENTGPRALGAVRVDDVYAGSCGGSSAGYSGSGIQRWTGSSWSLIGTMDCVSNVFALPSGDVYVVGMDERWGPLYMARFRDGNQQESFTDYATQVVESDDGAVYAVFPGSRDQAGYVARREGASWTPLPDSEDIDALRWHPDGRLMGLTRPDTDAGFRLVVYNGSGWDTLYDDTADPLLNGYANDVEVHPEWGVVAAGSISGRTDRSILHVAAFENGQWNAMTSGGGLNGGVSTLEAKGDSLFVAGSFSRAGSVDAFRIALWHDNAWSPLESVDGSSPGSISDLAIAANGDVWFAGRYTNANQGIESGVFRWNGSSWDIPDGGVTGNGNWQDGYAIGTSVLARADGSVIVGGWFSEAGGQSATRMASWNAGTWTAIDVPLTTLDFQTRISMLSECPDGSILVGVWGSRQPDGTMPLLRWDGTTWSTVARFTRDGGDYVAINAIDCTEEGIIVGGIFDAVDGVAARNVAQFDGQTWTDMQGGMNGGVRAMARDYAGNLVVSGDFRWAGTTYAARVARWMEDSWHALGTGDEFESTDDRYVFAMASLGPDAFYLGGRFTQAGSVDATHLARFDFTKFDPGFEEDDPEEPVDPTSPVAFELTTYPNPGTASAARIRIALPEADRVTVRIYDVAGRTVGTPWTSRSLDAGTYELPMSEMGNLPAGVYWIRVETDSHTRTTSWVNVR